MYRLFENKLIEWKNSATRKPLIVKGARQVGKTYILKKFGQDNYKNVAYFNCDGNETLKRIFEADYNMDRILRNLSAQANKPINPGETLIILDEIQEIPKGLSALKYFCEEAREYHIAVAGSLLGIALHRETNFPVGKVDILYLEPMNFDEFVMAMGKNGYVEMLTKKDWESIKILKNEFIELLRQYYFVGGMPEAVKTYLETKDIFAVRKVQKKILETYRDDVSKHAPTHEVPRINMVWNSLPAQLAKENKKFIYGAIKKGSRASEFEVAIQWLVDCNIVKKVNRIKTPQMPLKFYEDFSAFKLFMLDCGLLAAMADTPPKLLLVGDNGFKEFKGAFTENFVLQQLVSTDDTSIYYYSNDQSTLEIDFVVQHKDAVIPIEVKAEENLRAKSLRTFVSSNEDLKGIRLSMSDYKDQEWMVNIPLYSALHIF